MISCSISFQSSVMVFGGNRITELFDIQKSNALFRFENEKSDEMAKNLLVLCSGCTKPLGNKNNVDAYPVGKVEYSDGTVVDVRKTDFLHQDGELARQSCLEKYMLRLRRYDGEGHGKRAVRVVDVYRVGQEVNT